MARAERIARRKKQKENAKNKNLKEDVAGNDIIGDLFGVDELCQKCGGELIKDFASFDPVKGTAKNYSCAKCGAEQPVVFPEDKKE
jgi:predicted RNA-binding Zn-ribbon protein involved in translation (DUF1610 family)